MVALEPVPVSTKHADPETIDWDKVAFSYDADADISALHLFGRRHPSAVFHTGGGTDLLIDPETEIIVGYQIEGFLTDAVYRDPTLLAYAEFADIPSEAVAEVRARIARESMRTLTDSFGRVALRSA
jgi:hypothetical protein